MKNYVMLLAAFAFLSACTGKKEQKIDEPIILEEEVVITKSPDPTPINMRDSLEMESDKGNVVEKQYSGLLPGADVPGIEYDLTLYFQQDSENGVFALRSTYLDAEDGNDATFMDYGKRKVIRGIPADKNAIVYRLIPNDGSEEINFQLMEGGDLTLLDKNMHKIDSDHNYTLKLIR